jgi:hypothetical protein
MILPILGIDNMLVFFESTTLVIMIQLWLLFSIISLFFSIILILFLKIFSPFSHQFVLFSQYLEKNSRHRFIPPVDRKCQNFFTKKIRNSFLNEYKYKLKEDIHFAVFIICSSFCYTFSQ